MKKKKIIICVAIALAVFCLSFASAMIILMLNQDGVQTDTFNDSPVGQNFSRALNNCSEPQDYYALAQKLVDDNKIYYANEVIKYGYRQTKDKSLDIAVITGKPTVATAVIQYGMSGIAESVQYFFGRDTVISKPCYSGFSRYNNAFIYTFEENTHRIQAIETATIFSYDKLDKDLLNICLASEHMHGVFYSSSPSTTLFDEYINNPKRKAAFITYQFDYNDNGTVRQLFCGENKITFEKTASGYDVTVPSFSYLENDKTEKITFEMQNKNILRISYGNKSRGLFNYENDGSYTVSYSKKETDRYKLYYDKNNIINKYEEIGTRGEKADYSYNSNHLLSKVSIVRDDETNSAVLFYKDDFYITNFMDHILFSYDADGRIESIKGIESSDSEKTNDTNYKYNQNGQIAEADGLLSSGSVLSLGGPLLLSYNDENILTGIDIGDTYNIVRNEIGLVTGVSFEKATNTN